MGAGDQVRRGDFVRYPVPAPAPPIDAALTPAAGVYLAQVATGTADCPIMGRIAVREKGPLAISVVTVVVTLAVLPFSTRDLGPTTTGYVSAVLAIVACFDLMSMWLLLGEYADTGDRRMLAMGVAYLWSLALLIGYSLSFPGVVSPTRRSQPPHR